MKNKIFILLAVLTGFATACNDWLDVSPKTEEPAASMFDTYQGYKDVLAGCYIKMKAQSLYGAQLTITTVEYLAQHWDVSSFFGSSPQIDAIKKFDYEDDNVKPQFQSIYDGMYNIIVQANTIIEAMPETGARAIEDDQARGIIAGESYAIRAFCHFDILRLFGQVPGGSVQVRLPYTEDVSREPSEYYNFRDYTAKIESDLKRAEELLEEHDPVLEYSFNNVNSKINDEFLRYRQLRLNYWAVKALQARFYLYINEPDKAYAAAKVVLEASQNEMGFQLNMQSNIGSGYFAMPGEGLFILNNHQLKEYINSFFPGYGGENYTSTYLYMDPVKLSDPGMFEVPVASSTDRRYNDLWSQQKKNQYGEICPELLKYKQEGSASLSALTLMLYKEIMPMLRLSEVYLILIETSNDLAEINELYETFRVSRNFAQLTFASKSEAMEVIAREYRREFFGEGQMFYFYKRNKASDMLWSSSSVAETDYIIPLPETEFDPNL